MENWLSAPLPVLLKTVASCVLIMLAIMIIIRIYGLRSLAKMSGVDFASTIAIGSIIASVAINTGTSLLKGCLAIIVILAFQQAISRLKRWSDPLESAVENNPIFLMRGARIEEENMAKTGVTRADLMAKLREANVIQLSEVKAVIFETTGDISVLHGENDRSIDPELLEGIAG